MKIAQEKEYMYALEDKGRRHRLFEADTKLSVWNLVADKNTQVKLNENHNGIQSIELDSISICVGTILVNKRVKSIKKFRGRILVQLSEI